MSTSVYVQAETDETEVHALPAALPSSPSKPELHDITWSNVNFSIGEKKILTDCWGNVRDIYEFYMFLAINTNFLM